MKMWKCRSFLLALLLASCSVQPEQDIAAIHAVLEEQVEAWNQGDLEGFMQGYWKNDALSFTGGKRKTLGWQQALDNYVKSYPDKEAMGELTFSDLDVEMLSNHAAFVTGAWMLQRTDDTLSGRFTLVWKYMAH